MNQTKILLLVTLLAGASANTSMLRSLKHMLPKELPQDRPPPSPALLAEAEAAPVRRSLVESYLCAPGGEWEGSDYIYTARMSTTNGVISAAGGGNEN